MTGATFTPTCPACRYDLSATPDGRCPECGEAFTHKALKAAHDAALADPPLLATLFRVVAGCGLALGIILLLVSTLSSAGLIPRKPDDAWRGQFPNDGLVPAGCLLLVPWLLGRVAGRSTPLGLAAVPTVLLANYWFWRSHFGYEATVPAIGMLVGLCVLGFGLIAEPRRTLAWIIFTPATILGLTGLLTTIHAASGPRHAVWTTLCDPRPGQLHAQYPLRRDEAAAIGLPMLVTSLAIAGLASPLVRRREP